MVKFNTTSFTPITYENNRELSGSQEREIANQVDSNNDGTISEDELDKAGDGGRNAVELTRLHDNQGHLNAIGTAFVLGLKETAQSQGVAAVLADAIPLENLDNHGPDTSIINPTSTTEETIARLSFLLENGVVTPGQFASYIRTTIGQFAGGANPTDEQLLTCRNLLHIYNVTMAQSSSNPACSIAYGNMTNVLHQHVAVLSGLDTEESTQIAPVKEAILLLSIHIDSLAQDGTDVSRLSIGQLLTGFIEEYACSMSEEAVALVRGYQSCSVASNDGDRQEVFNGLLDQALIPSFLQNQSDFMQMVMCQSRLHSFGFGEGFFENIAHGDQISHTQDIAIMAQEISSFTEPILAEYHATADQLMNDLSVLLQITFSPHYRPEHHYGDSYREGVVHLAYQDFQKAIYNVVKTGDTIAFDNAMQDMAVPLTPEHREMLAVVLSHLEHIDSEARETFALATGDVLDTTNTMRSRWEIDRNSRPREDMEEDLDAEIGDILLDLHDDIVGSLVTTPATRLAHSVEVNLHKAQRISMNARKIKLTVAAVVITAATVATAGALAPAAASSGGVVGAVFTWQNAAAAVVGGSTLAAVQEGINAEYGEAILQQNISGRDKFVQLASLVATQSIYMFGAVAAGAAARTFSAGSAQVSLAQRLTNLGYIVGFDIAESVATTTAAQLIHIAEQRALGNEIDWDALLADTKSELGMALLMSIAGDIVGAGLEGAMAGARQLRHGVMQNLDVPSVRGQPTDVPIFGRSRDAFNPDLRQLDLDTGRASTLRELTDWSQTNGREFLHVEFTDGTSHTFRGEEAIVQFRSSEFGGRSVAKVYHGGPHDLGMSPEDLTFFRDLGGETDVYLINTNGHASVTHYQRSGLRADVPQTFRPEYQLNASSKRELTQLLAAGDFRRGYVDGVPTYVGNFTTSQGKSIRVTMQFGADGNIMRVAGAGPGVDAVGLREFVDRLPGYGLDPADQITAIHYGDKVIGWQVTPRQVDVPVTSRVPADVDTTPPRTNPRPVSPDVELPNLNTATDLSKVGLFAGDGAIFLASAERIAINMPHYQPGVTTAGAVLEWIHSPAGRSVIWGDAASGGVRGQIRLGQYY